MSFLETGGLKILFILSFLVFALTIALLIYTYSSIINDKDRLINSLRNNIDLLEKERDHLSSEIEALQSRIDDLTTMVNEYDENLSKLSKELTMLSNELDRLSRQNNELLIENSRLKNANTALRNSVEWLKRIVELRMNETLEKGKVVTVEPGKSFALKYNVSYHGYLEINFRSTAPVCFEVKMNFSNTIYQRFPVQGSVLNGGFIAPVLPGEVYIIIYNDSSEQATIVLDVSYYW